jgi:hypothetical protein
MPAPRAFSLGCPHNTAMKKLFALVPPAPPPRPWRRNPRRPAAREARRRHAPDRRPGRRHARPAHDRPDAPQGDAPARRHAVRLRRADAAVLLDEEHAAAPVRAFVADDGTIVNIDDMAAADARLALLHQAGALRAGDEQGLVREEGDQGRGEADRAAVPLSSRRNRKGARIEKAPHCQKKAAPAQRGLAPSLRWRHADQPKFFAAKSQFTSLSRKVSTNFGRALR